MRLPSRPRFLPAALLVLATGCGDGPLGPITSLPRDLSPAELQVIQGSNRFAFDLLRESVEARPEEPNVFLSPLSASMALGMTLNGADGATWTQMRDVLGFDGMEEPRINDAYRDLIALLLDLDRRVMFGLGNSIWTRQGLPVLPDFLDRARTSFSARVQELDFADPAARDVINAWVEEVTRGRIKKIVETIPPQVVMYLINAVYFKGDWTDPFDPKRTTTQPFTRADGSTVQVSLMSLRADFRSFATPLARGVELPYGGGAFTAVLVQPAAGADATMTDLVAELDPLTWDDWTTRLAETGPREAMVAVPRFEIEYEQVMNGALRALGMTDAFDAARADFSRMVEGGGIWVGEVKQKTFLKVDEKGTEAAAATSVAMFESAPPEFRFDRPFLLAIRERLSGTILFLGVIGDPS